MVIAKQVPPEHQESPMTFMHKEFDMYYPGVILTGNRNSFEHTTAEYDCVVNGLYDAQNEIHALGEDSMYENEYDVITDFFPPLNRDEYNSEDIEKWIRLLVVANNCQSNQYIAEALSLMTGCKYEYTTIRGCCQSDWQHMFYPADQYAENFVKEFENEYFNLGSEWIICEDHWYIHADGYDIGEVRDELCNSYGIPPEELQILKFNGWKNTAIYEEVSFDD